MSKSVEDIIGYIEKNIPAEGRLPKPLPVKRFLYSTVDEAVSRLHRAGCYLDLEVFDLPGTTCMWRDNGDRNYELARKAMRKLIDILVAKGADLTQVLPFISQKMFKSKINRFGTTLRKMLLATYEGSPYEAIADWTKNDFTYGDYTDFKDYDMRCAPKETWTKNGRPDKVLGRKLTVMLFDELKAQNPEKPFEKILSTISNATFFNVPINRYGTTIENMLIQVYDNDTYAAIRDVLDNVDEFREYRDFQPYDMWSASRNTWKLKDGSTNKELARKTTRLLLRKLKQLHPNRDFASLVKDISKETFRTVPINRYGTTLRYMLYEVYQDSPYQALKDLAEHDGNYVNLIPVIEKKRHRRPKSSLPQT